jgi:tetratricopeptide (TPR) repeat protein
MQTSRALDASIIEFFGDAKIPSPIALETNIPLYELQKIERWNDIIEATRDSKDLDALNARILALCELGNILLAKEQIEFAGNNLESQKPMRKSVFELKLMNAMIPFYEARNANLAILNIGKVIEEERLIGGDDFILLKVDALIKISDLFEALGNFSSAIDHLHNALEFSSADSQLTSKVWLKIGSVLYSAGDLQNCKLAFENAEKMDITKHFVREIALNKAMVLIAEDRFQEAQIQLELFKSDPTAVNYLAICFVNSGNSVQAVTILEDLIRKNPFAGLSPCIVSNLIQLYELIPTYSHRTSTLEKLCSIYNSDSFAKAKEIISSENSQSLAIV